MSDNRIIGENPEDIYNPNVQQTYPDTCAIKSQQLILEDFGINISENQLVNEAMIKGVYSPGSGTIPQHVGILLNDHGVPVETTMNATVLDLTRALAEGHKVIIGVDSGELWENGFLENFEDLFSDGADHALIVAGIDASTHEVILTDPGSGQEGIRYPLEQFIDAWQDSGNFMVETVNPAPLEHNLEMVGFDYNTGHIDNIGSIPYSYFEDVLLPINENLNEVLSLQDEFFNDFHNMVNGQQFTISPELSEAIKSVPFLENDETFDTNTKFEPYQNPNDSSHDLDNDLTIDTSDDQSIDTFEDPFDNTELV